MVLHVCHTGGVAGTGGVTNVSREWCCWHWWCYKCVTQVVVLALVVLQMCHAGGGASTGVTNVSQYMHACGLMAQLRNRKSALAKVSALHLAAQTNGVGRMKTHVATKLHKCNGTSHTGSYNVIQT
jgi:hypothetical protein